jgi:glycosyltransferase involved in cell wall biosynthesis
MSKRIIIAVTNDLVTDQRISRIADTLAGAGYSVVLVGRLLSNREPLFRKYKTKRFRLSFNKGMMFYANYNIRLFFYLIFHKFDIVLSNDLDTLLASVLASKIKYKKCVYDSHEYFTEVPELVNRNIQKKAWEVIEKFTLPKTDYRYTVSQSIADEYFAKYGKRFDVIRNLPIKKSNLKREKSNIIIYQGALNKGRGIELMIETMEHMPDNELWIVGAGDIEKELMLLTKERGLEDRVRFLGRIPFEELKDITTKAIVGLSLEEDLGKNYRYALPNKLFDYIQAQIPVLVSDLPEMKRVVEEYKIGEILENRNPNDVALQIFRIIEKSDSYKATLSKASAELCWENEKIKLLNIFDKA